MIHLLDVAANRSAFGERPRGICRRSKKKKIEKKNSPRFQPTAAAFPLVPPTTEKRVAKIQERHLFRRVTTLVLSSQARGNLLSFSFSRLGNLGFPQSASPFLLERQCEREGERSSERRKVAEYANAQQHAPPQWHGGCLWSAYLQLPGSCLSRLIALSLFTTRDRLGYSVVPPARSNWPLPHTRTKICRRLSLQLRLQ